MLAIPAHIAYASDDREKLTTAAINFYDRWGYIGIPYEAYVNVDPSLVEYVLIDLNREFNYIANLFEYELDLEPPYDERDESPLIRLEQAATDLVDGGFNEQLVYAVMAGYVESDERVRTLE